jgi:A/G-specific adenine glycosylase
MDCGTALARQVPNPNRRSRAYVRQSRFEGSDRQVRGAILRALLVGEALNVSFIARSAGCDLERALRLLRDLEREGFVRGARGRFTIAGREETKA